MIDPVRAMFSAFPLIVVKGEKYIAISIPLIILPHIVAFGECRVRNKLMLSPLCIIASTAHQSKP